MNKRARKVTLRRHTSRRTRQMFKRAAEMRRSTHHVHPQTASLPQSRASQTKWQERIPAPRGCDPGCRARRWKRPRKGPSVQTSLAEICFARGWGWGGATKRNQLIKDKRPHEPSQAERVPPDNGRVVKGAETVPRPEHGGRLFLFRLLIHVLWLETVAGICIVGQARLERLDGMQ